MAFSQRELVAVVNLHGNVAQDVGSDTITNTTTATVPVEDSILIGAALPANWAAVGDKLNVELAGNVAAYNSGTLTVQIAYGSTAAPGSAVILASTGALTPAASDGIIMSWSCDVRTIGASGTLVGAGFGVMDAKAATASPSPLTEGESTVATNAAAEVFPIYTWSAANAGNQVSNERFSVTLERAGL